MIYDKSACVQTHSLLRYTHAPTRAPTERSINYSRPYTSNISVNKQPHTPKYNTKQSTSVAETKHPQAHARASINTHTETVCTLNVPINKRVCARAHTRTLTITHTYVLTLQGSAR